MADFDNVWDPALVQQLVALGGIPDQQALAMKRMEMGREDSTAQMPRGYQVGNTYMAASPMEHLAAALQRGMGVARQMGGEREYRDLIGQQAHGRNAYAAALARLFQPQDAVGPVPELEMVK